MIPQMPLPAAVNPLTLRMWLVKLRPSEVVKIMKLVEIVGEEVETGITMIVFAPEPETAIESPTRCPDAVGIVYGVTVLEIALAANSTVATLSQLF